MVADIAADLRLSRMHFLRGSNRYRRAGDWSGQPPEDALLSVGRHFAKNVIHVEDASEFPWLSHLPLFHLGHRRAHHHTGLQRHQDGGLCVVDAVSQCAKIPCIRVIVGHRADPCHGIPHIGAQTASVCRFLRIDAKFRFLAVAQHREHHLALFQALLQRCHGMDSLAIHFDNHIALLEPRALGGGFFCKASNQYALGIELHANGTSAGNEHLRRRRGLYRQEERRTQRGAPSDPMLFHVLLLASL